MLVQPTTLDESELPLSEVWGPPSALPSSSSSLLLLAPLVYRPGVAAAAGGALSLRCPPAPVSWPSVSVMRDMIITIMSFSYTI